MGRVVIRDLNHMVSKERDFQIRCTRCDRSVVLEGKALYHWVKTLRWCSEFDSLARRFPCEKCGPRWIEWGFLMRDHEQPVLDLSAVAKARRDAYLRKARFWHQVAMQRYPKRRS